MSSKCFIIFQCKYFSVRTSVVIVHGRLVRKKCSYLTISILVFIQVVISQKPFSLKVDDNGRYSLYVNGNVWLESAPTFFRDRGKLFSTGDGTLKLFYTGNEVGVDKLGNFTTKDYLYRAGSREFFVSIRQYDDPNFLVFVQVLQFINDRKMSMPAL